MSIRIFGSGGGVITDATATPEDVVLGRVFYNNDGRQVGNNPIVAKSYKTLCPLDLNTSIPIGVRSGDSTESHVFFINGKGNIDSNITTNATHINTVNCPGISSSKSFSILMGSTSNDLNPNVGFTLCGISIDIPMAQFLYFVINGDKYEIDHIANSNVTNTTTIHYYTIPVTIGKCSVTCIETKHYYKYTYTSDICPYISVRENHLLYAGYCGYINGNDIAKLNWNVYNHTAYVKLSDYATATSIVPLECDYWK